MGIGGISIWQLIIILVIVLLLFGTKRLRNIGSDLGNAVKGFRGAMRDGEAGKDKDAEPEKIEKPVGAEKAGDATAATSSRDKERT